MQENAYILINSNKMYDMKRWPDFLLSRTDFIRLKNTPRLLFNFTCASWCVSLRCEIFNDVTASHHSVTSWNITSRRTCENWIGLLLHTQHWQSSRMPDSRVRTSKFTVSQTSSLCYFVFKHNMGLSLLWRSLYYICCPSPTVERGQTAVADCSADEVDVVVATVFADGTAGTERRRPVVIHQLLRHRPRDTAGWK